MNERQYLLHHLLYLSSKLPEVKDAKERQNLEQALLFYANELRKSDSNIRRQYLQ